VPSLYHEYSLGKQGIEPAEEQARGRVYSRHPDDLYNELRALFRMVDQGDPATGVPEYDGGSSRPVGTRK
jgi:hypothetical protein